MTSGSCATGGSVHPLAAGVVVSLHATEDCGLKAYLVSRGLEPPGCQAFQKSNFIQLESPTTLYERGDKLANAITVELKVLPRL